MVTWFNHNWVVYFFCWDCVYVTGYGFADSFITTISNMIVIIIIIILWRNYYLQVSSALLLVKHNATLCTIALFVVVYVLVIRLLHFVCRYLKYVTPDDSFFVQSYSPPPQSPSHPRYYLYLTYNSLNKFPYFLKICYYTKFRN